jgi:hypothetical protein
VRSAGRSAAPARRNEPEYPSRRIQHDDVDWEAIARTRRSVREYLDTLDEAAWGAASETVPKFISKSDPAAQWTGAHKGHAFFAYADNYLIDLKVAIIIDVEATRAIRQA